MLSGRSTETAEAPIHTQKAWLKSCVTTLQSDGCGGSIDCSNYAGTCPTCTNLDTHKCCTSGSCDCCF